MNTLELQKQANEIRKGIIAAVHSAKSGHPGGSLSAADIFTYLYFEEMNIDPKNPKMEDRDRFVLSKGHVAPGLYAALAHRGYFPVEDLTTLRHVGSYLQGHPDMKHIPGVDMSSGSLGQGLSAAVGMALAGKMDEKDYRVYALCGDGEIQEGQIWEAAMFAGYRKLDNLVVIVDLNGLQIDGAISEICDPEPLDKKFEAFRFHTITIDGNAKVNADATWCGPGIGCGENLTSNGLSIFKLAEKKAITIDGTAYTLLEALELGEYGKVYLSLGVNELGYYNDEGFYQAYCDAIDAIRACQPDAVIYIQGLIPLNESVVAASGGPSYLTNEHLRVYNGLMQKAAEEKQVVFLDLYSEFANENGELPEEASKDGVHLKSDYCKQWLEYLKVHTVDFETLYPEGTET